MELGSLIEFFLSSELEKYLFNRQDLKVGEKLLGKIIEIKENGNILIDFKKFRTIAKVKFPVKVGQKINVKVIDKGENLKFSLERNEDNVNIKSKEILEKIKIVEKGDIKELVSELKEFVSDKKEEIDQPINSKVKNNNKNFIKGKLSQNLKTNNSEVSIKEIKKEKILKEFKIPVKIKNIVETLNNHFKPLGPAEDILKIINALKNHIENSGIFFESKIGAILKKVFDTTININTGIDSELETIIKNDLKPNLLILKEYFKEDAENFSKLGAKKLSFIRDTIDELILNINKQQDNSVKKSLNPDTMQFFTFQIPLKNKKNAKLRVYYNKNDKKKNKKGGFNLSLLLVMDNLGKIRADFFLLKEDLNITFYVENIKIRGIFNEKLNLIKDTLFEMFRFLNINVLVSKKKIRDFDNEAIADEFKSNGFVDLRV